MGRGRGRLAVVWGGGEGRRGVTPRPSPHAARGTRGSWSRAGGAGRAWPRGGCLSAPGASCPLFTLSPSLPASLPPGGGQPAGSCRLAPGL